MARITKLELAQALAERNTQLEAARLRIAELEGDLEAARRQLGSLQPNPAVVQSNYQRACALARELAMKTGRSVKVG